MDQTPLRYLGIDLNTYFKNIMTCGGSYKSMCFIISKQTNLIPLHRPRRDVVLGWPGRDAVQELRIGLHTTDGTSYDYAATLPFHFNQSPSSSLHPPPHPVSLTIEALEQPPATSPFLLDACHCAPMDLVRSRSTKSVSNHSFCAFVAFLVSSPALAHWSCWFRGSSRAFEDVRSVHREWGIRNSITSNALL